MKRVAILAVLVLTLGLLAAASASIASAKPIGDVLCGQTCGGGGGTTQCGTASGQDHWDDGFIGDWYTVYLGVNFCWNGSTIVSASIQQDGCRAGGIYGCGSTNGPFLVGGGPGQGFAHYTYNANVILETTPPNTYNKTVDCYVYASGSWSC